jgi:hypothetical protein
MALVPHERSLVKRLEKKPFAFLGINVGEERDTVKKVVQKEKITWRSWWDQGGGICKKYKVKGIPAIYVLDSKGVIRFKDVHKETLDKAVDYLLKEMERERTTVKKAPK